MEKLWIIPLLGLFVLGGAYWLLYDDHMELQQHYEWALEFSKLTPSERQEIGTAIKSQKFI